MADAAAPITFSEPKEKKSLVKRLLLPLLLLIAGIATGAAAMFFVVPMLDASSDGTKKPPAPKVAPLEYVEIENSFTSNFRDTGRFMQVKIAVSTQGGGTVVDAVKRHQVAVVAAVLNVLANTSEADLSVPGGREALTRDMRIAINDVLQRKSGIAGIDDVFITSFVMQ